MTEVELAKEWLRTRKIYDDTVMVEYAAGHIKELIKVVERLGKEVQDKQFAYEDCRGECNRAEQEIERLEKEDAAWREINKAAARTVGVLEAKIINIQDDLADAESVLERLHDADYRGVQMWRDKNPGTELVLPDKAHLTEWLITEMERLQSKLSRYQGIVHRVQGVIPYQHCSTCNLVAEIVQKGLSDD